VRNNLSSANIFLCRSCWCHEAVRKASNLLRDSVNQLAHANTRLSGEVDKLEHSVFCLKETENRLKDITGQQDLNVKNLVNLVAVNQEILDEKQKLVRQDVVADVVSVVLKADMDESGDFNPKEIRRMITYIEGLPSIKVNHKRLEKALAKNNSVGSIIDVVNDLARDDIEEKKRIFTLNWEDKKLMEVLDKKKEEDKKRRESLKVVGSDKESKYKKKKKKKESEEKKIQSSKKDDEASKSPIRESKKKSVSDTKKKSKLKSIDLDDSISSELSVSKKSKKKSKNDDSDSDVSGSKRKSSKSSKKKGRPLFRDDSSRSLTDTTSTPPRPILIRKSSSLQDLTKKGRASSGRAVPSRGLLAPLQDPPSDPPSNKTEKSPKRSTKDKKKGLLGLGLR
jgi:septal ring factor EnvC (AmiA/AmiB activator)